MYKGSCQCGSIRYEISGPVREVIACHCRECRKMGGHYFAATAASWEDISIVDAGSLTWYASSETSRRGFCGKCGSSLFLDHGEESPLGISAGSLDDASGLTLTVHIYADEKGEYYDIEDGVLRMRGHEWRRTGWGFLGWLGTGSGA